MIEVDALGKAERERRDPVGISSPRFKVGGKSSFLELGILHRELKEGQKPEEKEEARKSNGDNLGVFLLQFRDKRDK